MALYVILGMDKPDSLELRMATREAHFAHLAKYSEQVRLGGPFLDEDGRMTGSMIILEAESLEEARAFHTSDPYTTAGLFESSEVRPWRATAGGLGGRRSTVS